MTSDLNYF